MEDRVTIHEVAELAKVSTSTVSRVLNRPGIVKADTRDAVYSAIEELNYVPPSPKQEGREKKSIIGLAVPDVRLTMLSELVQEIEVELEKTEYDLLIINMKKERNVSKFFRENALYRKKIDGLIIFSAHMDKESAEGFRSMNIPVVLIQNRSHWAKSISTNNYLGGFDGTEFLVSRGYRRIAFIGWTPDDAHLSDRLNGYKNALEKVGIPFVPEMAFFSRIDPDGGYEATERLLESYQPEAIFYACDAMAMGGYRYFREKNIRVPEDIGVIGFDDLEPAAIFGLTTMKQFIQVKAKMAISYLLEGLTGKLLQPSNEEICITPKIVVRNSTR